MKKDQYIEKGLSLEQMRLNRRAKRRIILGTAGFYTLTFVAWNLFWILDLSTNTHDPLKPIRNPFKLDTVTRFKKTATTINSNGTSQTQEMESISIYGYSSQLRAIYKSGDVLYIKKYVMPKTITDENLLDAIKKNDVAFVDQNFSYTIEEVPMTEPFEHLEENTWHLNGMVYANIETTEIETPEENLEDISLLLKLDCGGVVICAMGTAFYCLWKSEIEYEKKKKSIKQLKF